MSLGSDPHLPRHTRLPSRRIDTAVSFIDTSRPTYSAIFVLRFPAPKPVRSRNGLAAPSHHHDRKSSSRLHAGSDAVGTMGRLAPAITPCGRPRRHPRARVVVLEPTPGGVHEPS